MLAIGLIVVGLGAIPSAWAQSDVTAIDERLSTVRREMDSAAEEAQRLAAEAQSLDEKRRLLAQELVVLAAEERRREEAVRENDARLAILTAEESRKAAELAARRRELATTLQALLRIARNPPEGLIAMPASLDEIYLTGRLIAGLVPALEAHGREIALDLDELARMRGDVAAEHVALKAARADLAGQRIRVAVLVEETSRLHALTTQDQVARSAQVAMLAAEVADLEALIAEAGRLAEAQTLVESEPESVVETVPVAVSTATALAEPEVVILYGPPVPTAKPSASAASLAAVAPAAGDTGTTEATVALAEPGELPSFTAAKGILPVPAAGTVVAGYGDRRSDGTVIKGLVIDSLSDAQVIAPFDGEIVYAGPFRNYGQLLIIAHGEGYHTVLAGFATINVATGQSVLAGEPVGSLGEASAGKATLYVELRHDGEPIDPAPWLSQLNYKDEG